MGKDNYNSVNSNCQNASLPVNKLPKCTKFLAHTNILLIPITHPRIIRTLTNLCVEIPLPRLEKVGWSNYVESVTCANPFLL